MADPYALDSDELALIEELTQNFGQTRGTYRALLTIIEKQRLTIEVKEAEVQTAKRLADMAETTARAALVLVEASKPKAGP